MSKDTAYIWNLKSDTNGPVYKTDTDSQPQEKNLQLPKRKGRKGKGVGTGIKQDFGISRYEKRYIK